MFLIAAVLCSAFLYAEYNVAVFTENVKVGTKLFKPVYDSTDFYVPSGSAGEKFPGAVFLQGAKVDKAFYGEFAKKLASEGFIVAIPNHSSLFGADFADQKVFTTMWDYLKSKGSDSKSPLFNKVDTSKVVVMGHSFGGTAALNIAQNKCGMPSCIGWYSSPKELKAALLFGTNNVAPVINQPLGDINNIVPVIYLQGDLDGKAKLGDTWKSYRKTKNISKMIAIIKGANHYAITNVNNPSGAAADPNSPAIEQSRAIEKTALFGSEFLKAFVKNDTESIDFIEHYGNGDFDVNVSAD